MPCTCEFGLGGRGLDWLFNDFVYSGLIFGAGLVCAVRARIVREERLAWAIMALGLVSWTGGEIYWTLVLGDLESPPFPSPADALYLGLYPCAYVTLVLLIRARVAHLTASHGSTARSAALAVAAVAAAVALGPIVEGTEGDVATVATTLAYPLGDLVLLSLVIGVFGVCGWRPGGAWLLIGLGLVTMAVADGIYLFQSAEGTYVEGTLLDAGWPAAALLIARSAWRPRQAPRARRARGAAHDPGATSARCWRSACSSTRTSATTRRSATSWPSRPCCS